MAKDRFLDEIKFPLSGDVTQAINPWSWWLNSMQQVGFVNINQMESSNPEMERKILDNVAGYGRQLGRLVEALSVVLDHAQLSDLSKEDRQTLKYFSEMAAEIAAVKGGYMALGEDKLDRFLMGLRYLKEHDPNAYAKILGRLRQELPIEPVEKG